MKEAAERFHARYRAVGKTYCYTCYVGATKPVFNRRYVTVLDFQPDVEAMVGHNPDKPDVEITCECDPEKPLAALAFKLMSDPFIGHLTFLRLYSGRIETGMSIRKLKPTSAGRRFQTVSTFEEVTRTTPEKSLVEGLPHAGRVSRDPAPGADVGFP